MCTLTYMPTANADFEIQMQSGDGLLDDTGRFDFTKTWTGSLAGTSSGVMLSAGDPSTGNAGYVALERFEGTLDDRTGSFVLQQNGVMRSGDTELTYAIAPGSGTGDLAGITGTVELDVDADGGHHVRLDYDLA